MLKTQFIEPNLMPTCLYLGELKSERRGLRSGVGAADPASKRIRLGDGLLRQNITSDHKKIFHLLHA